MKKEKLYIISIFFMIIIGICMFLIDIFYSLNNWNLILIFSILVLLFLFIVLILNTVYMNRKK